MQKYIDPIAKLINELAKLPGIGRKTAARLAFHIINADKEDAEMLSKSIIEVKEVLRFCDVCGNITDVNPCDICTSTKRDTKTICVVETPRDLLAIEATGEYNGMYHVLNGVISPMDGISPDKLNIKSLILRTQKDEIEEIILATNTDIEGEATATYLARLLKPQGIIVSRIAHGLPVGGDLLYADEVTLYKAIQGRKEM